MGGVNFTRNRAWWHTVIWDEYHQKHQYLMIIPTFAILIPYYWHGAFLNRDIEQNFAAKMYCLDYEQKRNRLTHSLIMEHVETHIEKVQDILDEIKERGFEDTFKEEIEHGIFNEFPKEKTDNDHSNWSSEKKAEYNQLLLNDKYLNFKLSAENLSFETRQKLIEEFPSRKYTNLPFRFLKDFPLSSSREQVERYAYVPTLDNYLPKALTSTIKTKEEESEE